MAQVSGDCPLSRSCSPAEAPPPPGFNGTRPQVVQALGRIIMDGSNQTRETSPIGILEGHRGGEFLGEHAEEQEGRRRS